MTLAFDVYWDEKFAKDNNVKRAGSLDEIYATQRLGIPLHTNLTPEMRDLVCAKSIAKTAKGVLILNCARGEIVNTNDMVAALKSGQVGGYGMDVLDHELPAADHPLLVAERRLHAARRVAHLRERGAPGHLRRENLILAMNGEKPIAQVNPGSWVLHKDEFRIKYWP